MIWEDFRLRAPKLARIGEERFERSGLVLLGTLRKNGWPRISPVEPYIVDGHLYLGMMWQSRKALDLLRDPRCTVHSVVSRRDGSEGEFKVYGRSVDIRDPEMRERFADAVNERIGWRPEEPEFHLFSVDVDSASFSVIQDGEWTRKVWTADWRGLCCRSYRSCL